ncbi:MAG: ATP-binding cassette domain-containing protein [Spirochaetia bacterium]|nr:ATP-binding cassette domain-containing protein [Spirochaetia bacterium]
MSEPAILVQNLRKGFGDFTLFDDFSFSCGGGRTSVLLGPSGCGKTTLLNLLAGLAAADSGRLLLHGLPAGAGRVSYLFQQPRLLPWLTVEKNLDFVLPPRIPRRERQALIQGQLARVSLEDAAGKYPRELSGGMAQRAAMARAFLFESETLLMDEAFQGLDLPLKFSLIAAFQKLAGALPKTTLFVTHDIREALLVGDDIFVLSRPPARVVLSMANPVPREGRSPGCAEFPRLEKELLAAL